MNVTVNPLETLRKIPLPHKDFVLKPAYLNQISFSFIDIYPDQGTFIFFLIKHF